MFRGITRGLQLMADAINMRYRAVRSGNDAATAALDSVFSTWFTEATGVVVGTSGTEVKIGIGDLLFGDPFAGSRAALRAVQTQFPGV